MSAELVTPPATAVNVDEQTLRYLGYDPSSIATRALVLLAQKYELDPLLGEIQLIGDKGGTRLYVTRDGMLAAAHRSGFLDGIVVEQQRRNSTNDGWTAFVSVWRKDMTHPFTYGAQCKDTETQAKAGNGPEMALARAERRALRRAFQIRTDFYPEHPGEELDDDGPDLEALTPASTQPGSSRRGDWEPFDADQFEAHRVIANRPVNDRIAFLSKWRIDDFAQPFPPEAVAEILAGPADGPAGEPAGPAGDVDG